MREVEVIEADNLSREVAFVAEGGEEEGDEGGFANALDAIDANEEGRRGGGGSVDGMAGEDEGDAVAALIIYYSGRHVFIYECHSVIRHCREGRGNSVRGWDSMTPTLRSGIGNLSMTVSAVGIARFDLPPPNDYSSFS